MAEWLSDNRAMIAAVIFIILAIAFVYALVTGRAESRRREKDEVFGDPERTTGGWYWAVCGVTALILVWGFFSWGMARAYFPQAANELCQVAKIDTSLSVLRAALPGDSRYFKSTTLVARNSDQLQALRDGYDRSAFTSVEQTEFEGLFDDVFQLIAISSDPAQQEPTAAGKFQEVAISLNELAAKLRVGPSGEQPSTEALAQPKWGTARTEIPLLPLTPKGVLFDQVSLEADVIARTFNKIRNKPEASKALIASLKTRIDDLEKRIKAGDAGVDQVTRENFIKSLKRIYRRLDDGTIFPAAMLDGVNEAVQDLDSAVGTAKGGLNFVEGVFFPSGEIVKSKTQCTEQGTGRWLPKPTDVIATFGKLANPDLEGGGGFKGTVLLWWKWLAVGDIVAFFTPDWIADILPGEYARHSDDGKVEPTFKDQVLAFAQGEVNLGYIPMLDGHIWDSLFRVLVALGLGVLLGVPLGIFMGVSRFFKSFFDPLIELYRPVPPLAWAPLILTIFGIQDDGKIFLLFMVAFAIMVISARTGASGTQLTKIRASHSLGASTSQILRHVILPNALPEIMTGIRIAIGVCWGTLVAAEMLAGTTGVGFVENVARTQSDYELIWVTILIMGILGLAFDIMMRWIIARVIPWRGKG